MKPKSLKGRLLYSTGMTTDSLNNSQCERHEKRAANGTKIWPTDQLRSQLETGEIGLVISSPMTFKDRGVRLNGDVDSSEIRRALLYWDKLVWPKSNGIYISHGPDFEYLEDSGILSCPKFGVNGDAATGLYHAFVEAYKILDQEAPGQWALSSVLQGFLGERDDFEHGRGVLSEFIGAIPIPDRHVPFEDILAFKEKRFDELKVLRLELGEFYQSWVNSEDQDHQFQQALSRIDRASADAIRVARESSLPFSLSSWKVSFSVSAKDVMTSVLSVAGASHFGLPSVGALALGVAPFFSASLGIGPKKKAKDLSAFNYVSEIEKELW